MKLKRIKEIVHAIDCLAEQRILNVSEANERQSGFQKIIEMEKLATLNLKNPELNGHGWGRKHNFFPWICE